LSIAKGEEMELREMIEKAAENKGGMRELATAIGIHPNNLTNAKRGERGLPISACGKLADILDIDRWTVVAASDLVTEKNPERRAYLVPFVQEIAATANKTRISIL
jgi:hypothetical protein